jgi:hypothetical protein
VSVDSVLPEAAASRNNYPIYVTYLPGFWDLVRLAMHNVRCGSVGAEVGRVRASPHGGRTMLPWGCIQAARSLHPAVV